MNSTIELTFLEINAIHKLMRRIKSEAYLSADEINHFSMSPFIASTLEKIHIEYMKHIRLQQKSGKLITTGQPIDPDPTNDFELTDQSGARSWGVRLSALSERGKAYIQTLDDSACAQYCDQFFAPFKPTDKQRHAFIELLKSIALERNK